MSGWDWSLDGWIILTGVLSACSCALPGTYLVLRRMSLMGDAISHAVLPGLAVAFLLSGSRSPGPMFVGAVVAGGLTAVFSEALVRLGRVEHGASMGVVFSVLFALGLVLIRQAADHVDLDPGCVLYGNITQVPLDALGATVPPAVRNLALVLALNIAFVVLFYKELKLSTFDPQLATALGINARALHYALMLLVALTTVANFEAVGSILVIAMLIVPPVAAHLCADRLGVMIALTLLFAALTAVAGHVLAAFAPGWLGWPLTINTAAMMAVVAGILLGAVILLAPHNGLIGRARRRMALRLNIVREDLLGLLHRWQELRPAVARPIRRSDVLAAAGRSTWVRLGLRSLRRRGLIRAEPDARQPAEEILHLTPAGAARAAGLVRSHRLWESFLARYFDLPLDHLHLSAERVEHYLTPEIRADLSTDLAAQRDPHGAEIPPEA